MSVTLHTDLGDIKLEIFCGLCPKSAEVGHYRILVTWVTSFSYAFQNFLALCASGYYDNNLFHRSIKGFMVQTGDPTSMKFS